MTSETQIDRPRTSRGRRNYEAVSSTNLEYGENFSQHRDEPMEHYDPPYTPRSRHTDEPIEQYDPPYTPRPKSSRQRPKSGYKVRRQQPAVVQPDIYSDDYHLYERSTGTVHYTDGITAAAAAKTHSHSPGTSYDSGVYDNPVNHYAPTPSPRPSSRPGSARPRTKQGQRHIHQNDAPDPDWRPTSSARPESAGSFSRYQVLPQIGSTANTPEPGLSGHMVDYTQDHYGSPRRDSSQREPGGAAIIQQEFIREHSFVGRKYKDIHENFDRKMKELSVNEDHYQVLQAEDFHNQETEPEEKGAIIRIPSGDGNTRSIETRKSDSKEELHSSAAVNSIEFSYPALQRKVVLPVEPKDNEDRLLLAVKLPSGQRVQRYFKTSDTLVHVLRFAEQSAQLDFSECEMVCDAPRKLFKDLNIKLSKSGLENRTVLHIQTPDE